MKIIIIALTFTASLIINACNTHQSTEYADYKLQQILGDNSWVEITDTIDVHRLCLQLELMNNGIVMNSEDDYKAIYDKSDTTLWFGDECRIYKRSNFDFSDRSILGFHIGFYLSEVKSYIFINDRLKKYLFLMHINQLSHAKVRHPYYRIVSIPKIKEGYSIDFDTTLTFSIKE